ncbi:MAG: hypothetical protein ABJN65_01490 [Parasphingorhabdus sp.]
MIENLPEQDHPDATTAGGVESSTSSRPLLDLPYSYARDHGILFVSGDSERIKVALHDGSDPLALLKIQRYLAMPLDLETVDEASFEKLLRQHYVAVGQLETDCGNNN